MEAERKPVFTNVHIFREIADAAYERMSEDTRYANGLVLMRCLSTEASRTFLSRNHRTALLRGGDIFFIPYCAFSKRPQLMNRAYTPKSKFAFTAIL